MAIEKKTSDGIQGDSSDYLLTDIKLTGRDMGVDCSDREKIDLDRTTAEDLRVVFGKRNICQAIINRLHTRLGELAFFGHPEYGSRLHLLLGEPNNARSRGLAEIYIRESLSKDPRIREIVEVHFSETSVPDSAHSLFADILIKTVEDDIVVPVSIALGG